MRAAAFLAATLLSGLCGCDKVRATFDDLLSKIKPPPARSPRMTDAERILRKFGQPREKQGVGRAVRSEQGISYNRKWNYFYSVRPGEKPCMRTIYFTDDRFTGSVVHRPDGKIQKEDVRFPY